MRQARDEDAEWVAELLSRDAPEPFTAERVRQHWSSPEIDRERDMRIDGDGAILVEVEGERAWLGAAGTLSPALLAWAEEHARSRGAARLLVGAWEGSAAVDAFERAGYGRWGSSLRFRIDFEGEPPQPRWPDGISVRTCRADDAERVYRAHLETFADMTEPMRASFEEWAHFLLAPPLHEPELWFLAEDGDELAGLALCHRCEQVVAGEIAILGVRRPWRGRGLGRALLEHAFAELARRGLPAAILGAEEDSPTGADRLYARVGMRVTHRRRRYEKVLA